MSVRPVALQTQIQEIKAQSFAAMLAIVGKTTSGRDGSTTEKPVAARIMAMGETGRMTLALPSGMVDIDVPPWLHEVAKAQPGLFAPGKSLLVQIDQSAGTLRLVLPDAPRDTAQPVVKIAVSATSLPGSPAAVQTPPPRPALFPPGTPGDAVEKLTGLRLPLAERADAMPLPGFQLPGLRLKPGASTDGQRIAQIFTPALAELVLAAALKQGPIAPALTALIASLQDDTLPPEARVAAQTLAANRLDGLSKPQPDALDSAIRKSGLTLEAQLLKAGSTPITLDLKAALLTLKAMISKGQGETPPAPPFQSVVSAALREAPVSPGFRPDAATPHALPTDLPRLIEGAIERITLQQVASLPEHHEMNVTDDRASGFRISTSLPLATQGLDRPQTAMIGLMLEHHPQGIPEHPGDAEPESSNGNTEPFPWKVRIALDLAETGPVEAEIRLRAQSVSITLWVERKSTAATARDEIGQLHKALEAAQFDVKKLDVRDGRPIGTPARRMMALDRHS